jgi:NAD(P)-dependent dehydrogenase (short-subunit alcohol dehydrogenase family)
LNAVINNAGTMGGIPFAKMTEAEFDFLVRNHLYTSFNVTKAAWEPLEKAGGGRIVMTTSGNGLFGLAGAAHYCAAKAGIYGLMRSLALEGAPLGIQVNAYWPSAFTRQIGGGGELRERMERTMPVEQSSPLAVWLAHPDCKLTGEVLHGGSGRVSRVFVAETPGVATAQLTLEDIGGNLVQAMSEDGYYVFKAAMDSSRAQTEIVNKQLGR